MPRVRHSLEKTGSSNSLKEKRDEGKRANPRICIASMVRFPPANWSEFSLQEGLSRAPRNWASGAVESCTNEMMTDGSKSGRVATLHE